MTDSTIRLVGQAAVVYGIFYALSTVAMWAGASAQGAQALGVFIVGLCLLVVTSDAWQEGRDGRSNDD